jgi:signal transduction histidine kinase
MRGDRRPGPVSLGRPRRGGRYQPILSGVRLRIDAALAAVCYLATIAVPVKSARGHWWLFVLAAVACAPLVWRRRYPVAVAAVTGAGTVGLALAGGLSNVVQPYGQLVATYTLADLAPPVWRLLAVLATAAGLVGVTVSAGSSPSLIGVAALPFAAAYALGTGSRARRDRIAMLEERTSRLAEAHRAAAARERERIAREMHDVLAHSVSLMVVQAEAGPVVVRSDPDRAEAAFDAIATTGRDALRQLRRALGILRGPDGAAERAPQPDLDGVPGLLADARRTGLDAILTEHGEPRPLPPELAIAAYRVVQESLTNTVKHAQARQVLVRLDWRDGTLRVEVSDDGRGAGDGPPGLGLVGMRERVTACGGQLRTGAGHGGTGFRVTAVLPL